MSTRCVVGIISESGKVGRYSHWDGYLDAKLPTLAAIVARDGATQAGNMLMAQDRGGWSSLDENASLVQESTLGGRSEIIVGYGEAYRDVEPQKPITFVEAEADGMIEYAYFVDVRMGVTYGDIHWHEFNYGGRPDKRGILSPAQFDRVAEYLMQLSENEAANTEVVEA